MNNAEKFEQNLLKSSVSNNLDAAKREWSLYRIDWVDRTGVPNKCVIHIYDPMLLRKALTLRDMVHETGLESYVKSGSAIIRDVPNILRFGYE